MARRNGNQVVLSRVPNCIGWVYRELEDLPKAIEYNEACVETARRMGIAEAEANALINLVYDYTRVGEPSRALKTIENVNGLFDRDEWNRWRFFDVRQQSGIAEFWLSQGNIDRAEEHARLLLDNAIRYGVPKYIAVAQRLLGEAAAIRGDVHTAEERLTASLEPFASNPAPLVEWKNYASLGRLFLSSGRPAAARAAFLKARRYAAQIAANIPDRKLRNSFMNSPAYREIAQ
jgi:tetratricopeptide (TPR) repeat protein